MFNLKNTLPISVHISSGGAARTRTGGAAISLDGISDGSFQVVAASRYRLSCLPGMLQGNLLLIGYENPIDLSNCSFILDNEIAFEDDVPEGTRVYFAIVDTDGFTPIEGDVSDVLYVSFYG
ncbi:MAG: hypothetical protein GX141_00295 [Armatimonadetes bacterium]|jgi:hypothetical protein|nr:hypothetical protein [Armatimonadota bacterium]